jgi:hypothetical protein
VSEEKFSKCEEGKNVSVEFRMFEKKGIEGKVPRKKIKVFRVETKVKVAKNVRVVDYPVSWAPC